MDIININLGNLGRYLDAYEHGHMEAGDTIDLFQALVDMDMIKHLRLEYTHVADIMIKDNQICGDLNQLRKEYPAAAASRTRTRYPESDQSLTNQRRGDQ